ncbi:hypothetical protein V1517DRAFT_314312 [Lipomyces orientalis]|uniref:Uncharacterized protein n=1 Tax=Lipomyces orientalis TaxID=1233043 RepID=A0ACC3TWS5_9ASCO
MKISALAVLFTTFFSLSMAAFHAPWSRPFTNTSNTIFDSLSCFGPVQKDFYYPRANFPKWLSDITGLHRWPGLSPPYVNGTNFNFSGIPEGPLYTQQSCNVTNHSLCSFDCDLCVGPKDIRHCNHLIQTFDDGPTPDTPTLLHHLHRTRNKASFFVLGIQVVVYPDVFRAMHNEGHFLASHTYGHKHLPSLPNRDIVAQLQWATWAMNATAGVIPKYFRPPFGGVDNRVRMIAERLGLTVIVWDLDTNDWKLTDASRTLDDIYDQIHAWKTSNIHGILLEHDNTMISVDAGIEISNIVGNGNITAANCKDDSAAWYG